MNKKIEKEDIGDSLKKLQRIMKLSASWNEVEAMLNAGLKSAMDIVDIGEDEFIDRYSKGLGGVEPAKKIYLLAHKWEKYKLCLRRLRFRT